MAVYRRSARPRFTLLLLVLTSITLITLDFRGRDGGLLGDVRGGVQDLLSPVQDLAATAARPLGNVVQAVVTQGDLEAENARLRAEVDELRGEANRAADSERELKALLDLQNLDFVGDVPAVSARIVSQSASNFEQSLVIDRGRDHGLVKGMPVVSGAGLVGHLADVSKRRSVVLLVTDLTSAVGVRLTSSGEVGIAAGRGPRSPLSIDLVSAATKVRRGEAVVTSGLQQSRYPPGIPVGTVSSFVSRRGALEQKVEVKPAVDFRRLAFVKVLQWDPAR